MKWSTEQTAPIDALKVNPKNPRIIRDDSFRELVTSIKKFPKMLELRPVVVDETMMILGGEKRWLAAKECGFKEIPIYSAVGLTEKEKADFILKDNHHYGEFDLSMLADWDVDILKDVGLWSDPHEAPQLETHGRKTGMRQIVFRYKEAEYNEVMKELQTFMGQEGFTEREKFLRFLLSMDNPK